MLELQEHTRQFLIGPRPILVRAHWTAHTIGPGVILSADPNLHVRQLRSADLVRYWLLGYALLTDREESLETAFSSISSKNVVDWTTVWTGRWLLVTPDECISDPSASLGLFYRRVDGVTWLSSSVSLLAHFVPGAPVPEPIPWGAVHGRGMGWIPAPFSTSKDILKVLPFRSVSMRTGRCSVLTMPSLDAVSTSPIEEIVSRLVTAVRNTARLPFSQREVHLTAGLDTRTILAAFVAGGITCRGRTHLATASAADKSLPPKLAATANISHRLIRRKNLAYEVYEERRHIIRQHTGGQEVGAVTDTLARAERRHVGDQLVIFGGLGFELGRCYFWDRLPESDARCLISRFTRERLHPRWHDAMSAWAATLEQQIPLRMDWRDRFYLEQRLGGWASANQQCGDLVGVTLHLANCAKLYQAMLQFDERDRRAGNAQREVIRRLAPELKAYPINPETWRERAWDQSRNAIRKLRRKLRALT